MHSMKIIFKNLGKLILKIEIDLGREPKILLIMVICKKCVFASCNTAFFELSTILKLDFPKSILSLIFFEKIEFKPVLSLLNHGLIKNNRYWTTIQGTKVLSFTLS